MKIEGKQRSRRVEFCAHTNKMALSLNEEEILAERVKLFPVLYDKSYEGYKEKDVVKNAWEKVGLKFVVWH